MPHHTLLGPHLLQRWDEFPQDVQETLKEWRPPVCVVFMDDVFAPTLQTDLNPATDASIEQLLARYDQTAVANNLYGDNFQKHIEPLADPAFQHTKLVGRIYIADDVVEDHILENLRGKDAPAETAKFHHRLVTAARKHLGALADRVNYWVIVNEKLGKNRENLRKLGQYEKTRMELANRAAYGCGLYAFANANPPLLGSPGGGREQYDAPTAPGLTHELAHWRDTDAHGLRF